MESELWLQGDFNSFHLGNFIYLFIWTYAFTTAAHVYLTVRSQTVQRYGKKRYIKKVHNMKMYIQKY